MPDHDELLRETLVHLRASFGDAIRVVREGPNLLALQAGPQEDAVVVLRISDPSVPIFALSYPARRTKGNRAKHVVDVTADGALLAGVEWVVRELVKHGVVTPEREWKPRSGVR